MSSTNDTDRNTGGVIQYQNVGQNPFCPITSGNTIMETSNAVIYICSDNIPPNPNVNGNNGTTTTPTAAEKALAGSHDNDRDRWRHRSWSRPSRYPITIPFPQYYPPTLTSWYRAPTVGIAPTLPLSFPVVSNVLPTALYPTYSPTFAFPSRWWR